MPANLQNQPARLSQQHCINHPAVAENRRTSLPTSLQTLPTQMFSRRGIYNSGEEKKSPIRPVAYSGINHSFRRQTARSHRSRLSSGQRDCKEASSNFIYKSPGKENRTLMSRLIKKRFKKESTMNSSLQPQKKSVTAGSNGNSNQHAFLVYKHC